MNVEQNLLAARAALHAALADPIRLRVVDLLAVGDASSSELSDRVGAASNLLAHHLRILESAGVIQRHRSEGDRRRGYWRLIHAALAPAETAETAVLATPERVVFVCTANSARSQLAAALWERASSVPATSAGTEPGPRIAPGALAAAGRHDLALADVEPRHLDDVGLRGEGRDLVVTVCDRAHEQLGPVSRVHWSVADPVPARTRSAFDRAYDDLARRVDRLVPLVRQAG
ncbi:arsenate reductase/protein-tyrosine-phosphatase family protein [Nocardioides nitrophenolicus]|uniref:arsenate reductase/protein-tyrosine-phosphatase family protein n=1 Tax=Nocardioides nitrophenolicus TaxID=60489 RepID=UPI0019596598|nr:helix-turn-helix domain-containing protein [Nocardioides nitrophenolicus]MBM7517643.1 protein-tyrosine-phosphatase [Nocardioides nitrophenolicus]